MLYAIAEDISNQLEYVMMQDLHTTYVVYLQTARMSSPTVILNHNL